MIFWIRYLLLSKSTKNKFRSKTLDISQLFRNSNSTREYPMIQRWQQLMYELPNSQQICNFRLIWWFQYCEFIQTILCIIWIPTCIWISYRNLYVWILIKISVVAWVRNKFFVAKLFFDLKPCVYFISPFQLHFVYFETFVLILYVVNGSNKTWETSNVLKN